MIDTASYRSSADKTFLSISGWRVTRLINAFVFLNPDPPITKILYKCQECWAILDFVFCYFHLRFNQNFCFYGYMKN